MSEDSVPTVSLREQLRCFSVVNAPVQAALDPCTKAIERHGRVTRYRAKGVQDCLAHLRPVMSFPTRHVLVGLGNRWSLIAGNMRFEDAGSPASAVGRALGVRSLSVSARDVERRFTFEECGQILREVHCFKDADSPWEFRERGTPLDFEDVALYRQRQKKNRLPVDYVKQVFTKVTGLPFVDFDQLDSDECYTFETPTTALAQAPVEFVTID